MKLIIILSIFISSLQSDDWCDGYDAGYQSGACYQMGYGCLPPLTPLCPLPTIYEDNNFAGGYNRGFVDGLNDRDER